MYRNGKLEFSQSIYQLCFFSLYKDRWEYEHEHEWRMLYYNLDNEDNYGFVPGVGCLKAIYYGPDIEDEGKLHEIAISRDIKEYAVSIDYDSPKYDLKISSFDL